MRYDEADRLLDPEPMPLETGYERLPDGVLHVACRTDLHGCTGEMFEWWFRSRPDTRHYRWWHPVDHVSSVWVDSDGQLLDPKAGTTHVGTTHKVEEGFTGLPTQQLMIQFRDAAESFDAARHDAARAAGRISAAVCARVGLGWDVPRLPDGRLLGGRLLHIGRDTPWGCALRSHFYLGQDLPLAGKRPQEVAELVPDAFGRALLQHCYNEFTFLSRFLPSLWLGDNRETVKVSLPW